MTEENPTIIRVEQLPDADLVFVFGRLKFNILFAGDVLHATIPMWIEIQMKAVRDGKVANHTEVTIHEPEAQGGGYGVVCVFGRTYKNGVPASALEDGDVIYINTPVPNLEDNILRRWYEHVRNTDNVWREMFDELEREQNDAFSELNLHYNKKRFSRRVLEEYNLENEALGDVFTTRMKELGERLRRESPLPEVLRF